MTNANCHTERWVLIALGDGYETHIAEGREAMERKFLELHFGPTRPAIEVTAAEMKCMESMLEALRDEDQWIRNYALGPVAYTAENEDGNVHVYRLTDEQVTK